MATITLTPIALRDLTRAREAVQRKIVKAFSLSPTQAMLWPASAAEPFQMEVAGKFRNGEWQKSLSTLLEHSQLQWGVDEHAALQAMEEKFAGLFGNAFALRSRVSSPFANSQVPLLRDPESREALMNIYTSRITHEALFQFKSLGLSDYAAFKITGKVIRQAINSYCNVTPTRLWDNAIVLPHTARNLMPIDASHELDRIYALLPEEREKLHKAHRDAGKGSHQR